VFKAWQFRARRRKNLRKLDTFREAPKPEAAEDSKDRRGGKTPAASAGHRRPGRDRLEQEAVGHRGAGSGIEKERVLYTGNDMDEERFETVFL
jgi:hypothetical protein